MATSQHLKSDDLSLVSGLYGPGNILCWYFTLASCLVSWTLDRDKRRSDSITVDLVVVLTLPAVAVAHLITQIHSYPGDTNMMMFTKDPDLLQRIHAIEAPFTITDIFLMISVLLFLLEFMMVCSKRAVAVQLVGVACYLAECYAHAVVLPDHVRSVNFRRSFAARSGVILFLIALLVGLSTAIAAGLATFFFLRRSRLLSYPLSHDALATWYPATRGRYPYQRNTNQTAHRLLAYLIFFGIPGGITVLWFPTRLNYTRFDLTPPLGLWEWINVVLRNIPILFFPRTSSSLLDLDQAIAALGGGTVLGFSLYTVANSWYEDWVAKGKVQPQQQAWIRMNQMSSDYVASNRRSSR